MKRKTILRWVLAAAILLAAAALLTGVARARTGSGTISGAAGDRSLSGTLDQLNAAMLSGGHYQLTSTTLDNVQVRASQASDLSGTTDHPVATTLSGGHYQLTSSPQGTAGQAGDLASGGGYHLKGLASPRLTGSGCCCLYLPCVLH